MREPPDQRQRNRDVKAKTALLVGAFRQRIESEIEENLDVLLAAAAPAKRGATKKKS